MHWAVPHRTVKCTRQCIVIRQCRSVQISAMASPGKQLCLVVGTPRGFTRSVLESLLKRGSRVLLSCQDSVVGDMEQTRLRSLYGKNQIHFSPVDHTCPFALESVFVKALDTFGEVHFIVNSTANDPLKLTREELASSDLTELEARLDSRQQEEDVNGIRRMGRLAVKYMGRHNGFQGGNLLNLTSAVELESRAGPGSCTVLGTTRAMGLQSRVARHGVRTTTVYQPTIDYPDLSQAAQITDDSHSPHNKWDRYSAYVRDYTGYMALHVGETAAPGTAWAFNKDVRLEEIRQDSLGESCGITNKMCFWMGCPMVTDSDMDDLGEGQRNKLRQVDEKLAETQENMD